MRPALPMGSGHSVPNAFAVVAGAWLLATAATVTAAAPYQPPPTPADDLHCATDNPYAVAACHPVSTRSVLAGGVRLIGGYTDLEGTAITLFSDTSRDTPLYELATLREVGGVWGLAYRKSDHAVYAAAFQKRQVPFGPGGPGAIYRVELATGSVDTFVQVPDAGDDVHDHNLEAPDSRSAHLAGKMSLGDLELSADQAQLFVVNLNDRHIYRYSMPGGEFIGRFAHGAAGEDWADDARPFGLGVNQGRLYHTVTRVAESSQEHAELRGLVYASQLDGSRMELVGEIPLDYERGYFRGLFVTRDSLDWNPWLRGRARSNPAGRLDLTTHPQPLLSDIAFDEAGNMAVGIRDRHGDTTLRFTIARAGNRNFERPGFPVGDLLLGQPAEDGWSFEPATEHFEDSSRWGDELHLGALTAPHRGRLIASGYGLFTSPSSVRRRSQGGSSFEGALWHRSTDGAFEAEEHVCHGAQSSGVPVEVGVLGRAGPEPAGFVSLIDPGSIGDLEHLCPAIPPTATPTNVPPTASPTPVPPTATPTPPSPTPANYPAFLPVALRDPQCVPELQHVDVVLVLDASSSMLELTATGRTKLDAARAAAAVFLGELQMHPAADVTDQAALVSFNESARTLHRLSADRPALERALGDYQSAPLTRIDLGIEEAHDILVGPDRRAGNTAAMIVLTDGRNNPEPVSSAVAAASLAKADGIHVFTVGLGDAVEVEALRAMASSPDGYVFAPSAEELAAIYSELAKAIPCAAELFWPYR